MTPAPRIPISRSLLSSLWLHVRLALARREERMLTEHAWGLERLARSAPRYARVYQRRAAAARDEVRALEGQL